MLVPSLTYFIFPWPMLMAVVALASRIDEPVDELRDELVDAATGLIGANVRQTAGSGRR